MLAEEILKSKTLSKSACKYVIFRILQLTGAAEGSGSGWAVKLGPLRVDSTTEIFFTKFLGYRRKSANIPTLAFSSLAANY